MVRKIALMAVAGMPLCASAGQPISESLMECAALYDRVAELMESRPDRAARLLAAGEVFYDAALSEARSEGRADPSGYAEDQYARKCDRWKDLSLFTFATDGDTKDWGDYCHSLGKARGLPAL